MKKINLLKYPKLVEILKYLSNNCSSQRRVTDIAIGNRSQYSSICKGITILEEIGLINKQKLGREVFIVLSPKGKEVSKKIIEIEELIR